LERYIKDDIERYGVKISDLDRKLTAAYREQVRAKWTTLTLGSHYVTQVESVVIEDDMLFDPEGEALISWVSSIRGMHMP